MFYLKMKMDDVASKRKTVQEFKNWHLFSFVYLFEHLNFPKRSSHLLKGFSWFAVELRRRCSLCTGHIGGNIEVVVVKVGSDSV